MGLELREDSGILSVLLREKFLGSKHWDGWEGGKESCEIWVQHAEMGQE